MNFKTLSKIAAVSTILLAASSSQAALVKMGTIKAIDLNSKVLVLQSGNQEQSYTFNDSTLINLPGNKMVSANELEQGQSVKVKFPASSKATRGEVVAVNYKELTADIKLKGSNTVQTIKFASNVSTAGIENFNELRTGHLVRIR